MNEFKNIKSKWRERNLPLPPVDGPREIMKKSQTIQKQQSIGQVVLFITAIVLVWFFFYISAFNDQQLATGLSIMIGCLTLRIIIEYISKTRLRKIKVTQEVNVFQNKIKTYYKSRLWIHYLITPVLFLLYIIGFILLLPSFKENLSRGFYLYIIISSIIIFILLGIFIAYQIKKEIGILKKLKTG